MLKPHRQRFTLASKCGMQGVDAAGDGKLVRVIDGRPDTIKKTCEMGLRRLRFSPENYPANLKLQAAYNTVAQALGCTSAQLALAWLLHKAPHIIPIPGTTSVAHLQEDLAAVDVQLSAQVMARLEALVNEGTVAGNRYNAQANSEVDTEVF